MSKINIDKIRKTFLNYHQTGEYGFKHFAVILPVVEQQGKPCLAYEVRAGGLERQPGEVCFPGGLIEKGETPRICALRETEEELGIKSENIEIVAELDSIYTTSGSQIYCFVGIISEEVFAEIKPSDDEVAKVFFIEIDTLLSYEPEMYYSAIKHVPDPDFPYERVTEGKDYHWMSGSVPVPVYEVPARDAGEDSLEMRIVWGLTGRMTKQFVEVLKCSD